MATRGPIQPQPASGAQLCDYCHLKPKFAGHLYCSKTCGTQAATLCNYCHKKPKFQNFEYCGKNCANLANPGGAKPAGAVPSVRGPGGPGQAKAKGAPNNAAQGQGLSLDPLAIARALWFQQMPQMHALLKGGGAPVQQPQQGPVLKPSSNNPFVNSAPQSQVPSSNNGIPPAQFSSSGNGVNYGAHSNSLGLGGAGLGGYGNGGGYPQQSDPEDLECLIPGCGKPVHVDAKGLKASDYCSQRHRDEAVASGLVPPCIMCMTKPQTRSDYFCSRACREESQHKQQQVLTMGLPNGEDEDEDEDDPQ
ncbi:hypothetical protein FA13DRAFT_1789019 [Coprinellus micaceus]|uniref:Uncharacterized protein n=1 Tax=Coprinellus micaceus TaxID=71717 RepID=A0A4Y7TK79_COPMI|nr:hypothetical protein FA13DRAFT_1789019 [Coprinellus micaceus]